ncbi:MAG: amino acid adenylation domain-containing protein [Rhizonema sp. PD37]|nr:amino acid adenylation domain-containing protein [Rhizonema sp. PD37]
MQITDTQKKIIKGFRISPQQKHLWLLQQGETTLPYRVQCAVRIEGNFDRKVFETALENVLNRHEILRTTFRCLPGMDIPLQIINDTLSVGTVGKEDDQAFPFIHEHNFSSLTPQEQEVKIEALFHEVSQLPFDFEQDSPLYIALVELSDERHTLLINLPAVYADTETLKNFVREISVSYAACLHGEQLFDEPIQYADVSEILNDLLESEETKAGREYWCQLNFSALFSLKLISENQPTVEPGFSPKFLASPIADELAAKIDAIAQKYETTTEIVLLTCFSILLWRLTQQSKILIGTACDGRNYEELESALGLFAKYLPLVCHLEENRTFIEILQQVNEFSSKNAEWQQYFTQEQTAETTGNIAKSSFFPFCFEFEHTRAKYSVDNNLSLSIYQQYAYIDRFKVKLSCLCREKSLGYEFHYDSNLFQIDDIKRLAGQFQTLLESVANNPEAVISRLEILSDQQRQQLLIEFNNTKTTYPNDKCIHHLLQEQVEQNPNNVAVIFAKEQLTYDSLNAKANQLAHYLQQLGVGPEVLVGICVERSLLMVVAVLGILKAGGAYVPIEPTYPPERQAYIITDSNIPILLTQQRLAANLPSDGTKVVCLDTDWEDIAQENTENPVSHTIPENLAYVIYTSGSTGKPKGTLIPHRGLVNYLNWCTQAYTVEQGTGTLVHSPLSFDLTITSLFSPLLVGGQVKLLPENRDIQTLYTALSQSSNLSLVKLTPAHLELLGQQFSSQEAAGRTRALIIGGENLSAQHIAFWQKFAPNTMLVNEYGPTETVVGCCIYQVNDKQQSGSIPIGHPIANTQLYVLDSHLQPVPIGLVGELHIGGKGVARGYLNKPELTAQKFIPNSFSNESGERLYKTGDLARYCCDGTLEFLGRIDSQVKLRGFRIELGEIEAALVEHQGVQESVVVLQEDVSGNQRLVAYIVLNAELSTSVSELSQFLKQKLPEYMVPSAYRQLDALPLTSNGKIDRKALAVVEEFGPELEVAYVPPNTEVEQTIAAVWQEVLHLEKVGIHDNFFDIGGHSLLIAQVHSQLQELLPQDLSMIELLEHPTINSLAKHLSEGKDAQLEVEQVRDRAGKQKQARNRQKQLRTKR